MSDDDADDPEIVLIAWRGRASALAARIGTPPKNLIFELAQLGGCKKGRAVYLHVDLASAPGRLRAMIERRHARLME